LYLALLASACTMQGTDIPSLSGPSELALSVTVTATPDTINWDGYSQSSVVVAAHGPDGAPRSNVAFRLDMATGDVLQDFGTLLPRTVVTGLDGRASAIYTAPTKPSLASDSVRAVSILATPIGSNAQTSVSHSAEVRLVRPGVILPPANSPIANFTFSPTAPTNGVTVYFNASSSCNGATPCSASGLIFDWEFGDGTSGTGMAPAKVYAVPGTYNVILEVINDRGLTHQITKPVTVGSGTLPTAAFVFSPSAPVAGQSVQFDASTSVVPPGRSIVSYTWNWGDGASDSGVTPSHTFTTAGVFNVTLTVTDNLGQKNTATRAVTVAP
jgi:PKD repeat protein